MSVRKKMRSSEEELQAHQVVQLLAGRHRSDLFFTEVKDGSSWQGGHLRLDAVAIRKTWSPVTAIGYEVKVSRSDWLADSKWTEYLELVNSFSIVAPAGVVQAEEVPAGVGIVEVASTGRSLRTIRKAVVHKRLPDPMLLLYLLLYRVDPHPPLRWSEDRSARIAFWKGLAEDKAAAETLGRHVKGRVRERIEELEKTVAASHRLGPQAQELDEWLAAQGQKGRWQSLIERVQSLVESQSEAVPSVAARLEGAIKHAGEALEVLENRARCLTIPASTADARGGG